MFPTLVGRKSGVTYRCVSQHIKCQDRATRPERGERWRGSVARARAQKNNKQTNETHSPRKLAHATLQNSKQTSETAACKLARATQQSINQTKRGCSTIAHATLQSDNQTSEAAAHKLAHTTPRTTTKQARLQHAS